MDLIVDKLTKVYKDKIALKDFSYQFSNGVYGIVGPNGAGKSTLFECISTLKKYKGTIICDNKDVSGHLDEYRTRIGYLPQHMDYYEHFTGLEFLKYILLLKKSNLSNNIEIENLMKRLNLWEVRNKKISTYSGGMKQRIGIIQCLLNNPKLVLLDEPTVGLDIEERSELKKLILEYGKKSVVLLSTHIISDIQDTANYIIFMNNGEIVSFGSKNHYDNYLIDNGLATYEDLYLKVLKND